MNSDIKRTTIELMEPVAAGLSVTDVRIGLIYTSVRLSNGLVGIAWTGSAGSHRCMHHSEAGTLRQRPAVELLAMLASKENAIHRSIGLATANALTAALPKPQTITSPILEILDIQAHEKVAMVGFFGPLIPRIRRTGCQLDIIELTREQPETLTPEQGQIALAACDVALITGTSLITDTLDQLMASVTQPRAAVILGPSTVMHPALFRHTPITHLAGSTVVDPEMVECIVSEGGGTKSLKPYLHFETHYLVP